MADKTKYKIEECDREEGESTMWHVIDKRGNEVFGPTEDYSKCEGWVKDNS